MELYLLRHAIAEDRAPGLADQDRALTAEGRRKLRRVIKWMKNRPLVFDLLLTSPLRRALQTSEEVRKNYPRLKLQVSEKIIPAANPADAVKTLRRFSAKHKRILVVGHEPFLGRLASFLLTGKDAAFLELKKAGLCRLDWEISKARPKAELIWMMTPGMMRGQ